jgi:PAS domain S-box-containing protein
MDAEGKIRLANPAAGKQFGYSPQELIGRPLNVLLQNSAPWDEMWAAVSDGDTIGRSVELEAVRRDGTLSYLEVSAARWLSESRMFVTAILRDVNERRAVEATLLTLNQTLERRVEERTAELMLAEEQLRQAQKMEAVGQLTGGIAHDFNNLLTGVIGSLDMLRTRVAQGRTDTIERYVTAATTSANRAAALTHRLLAFARRQPLDPKPVQANALVTSLEDLFRRTVGEAVTLEVILAGGLWPILCDPNQLENALLNLVINARDAMPHGGKLSIETCNVQLESGHVGAQQDAKPGHYVCISVTDTGSGMPAHVIERAFDPFFTTKPIGQGTGLGLSMVYGFARQSEGYAEIYSEVGTGTTFKIYLPRYVGDPAAEIEGSTPAQGPRAGTGETVLVVEDEPVVRSLIVEILEDLGYKTLEAGDGLEGLTIVQSDKRIDLLITDVGLPGLNGRQLADVARETRSSLKVLFITGYAENATLAAGFLQSGMQMITKPFAVDGLAQKIRSILRNDSEPE